MVHWIMMTVLYLIFSSRKFLISDFLVFLSQLFIAVNEFHKVWYPISIYTNSGSYIIPITWSSEHQTTEQYQGSADRGELDLKLDVNQPASGKLQQSTTVSSQCEQLYYARIWRPLYFDWRPHFKKIRGIVYPIQCKQKHSKKAPCYIWPY